MTNDNPTRFYILWFWAIIKGVSRGNGDTPSVFWFYMLNIKRVCCFVYAFLNLIGVEQNYT